MPTLPARVYMGHRKTFQPLWLLALASVLALALCGCSNSGATAAKTDAPGGGGSGRGGGRRGAGGDVPVTVAKSTTRDVPVEVQVIGNVEAYSTITVKALVGGQLTNVYFKEGDFVQKSEKLFDIDPRPLEAAYNQAVANIARDQASLLQAQANMARDQANAKYQDSQAIRYGELFKAGVISKDPVEEQVVVIWAGTTGQLDDIAVTDIKSFEAQFLDHLRREKDGLLLTIRESKKFDDDTQAGVQEAIDAFKKQFLAGGKDSVPVGHEPQHAPLPEADVEQVRIVKQKRSEERRV